MTLEQSVLKLKSKDKTTTPLNIFTVTAGQERGCSDVSSNHKG